MTSNREPERQLRLRRQMSALLHTCALAHWFDTLDEWLDAYEPLDHIVSDEREGPRASVVGLLRTMSSVSARPTDEEFAHLLAALDFFHYRLVRTPHGRRPSLTEAEPWDPTASDLKTFFSDDAYAPGGYPSAIPPLDPSQIARRLLLTLRQKQRQAT